MNLEQGFSIADLKGLVRRRIWMIVGCAWVALLGAVFLAAVLPNRYSAYATVLVEPPQISERLVEGRLEGSDLNQRLNLMTMQILSRPRLSKIIDDLDLYADESKQMTREDVIALMRGDIVVEPVLAELEGAAKKGSTPEQINTFMIVFKSDSPQISANVANRLANDFIEEHIRERVQLSEDTSEFIENELARLASRIQEVETRMAQIKSENPGKLPEDMGYNQRQLERTLSSVNNAERELDLARSDEAFYRQQLLASHDMGDSRDPNSPARRMEALEIQLMALNARGLTEKHPDVVATQTELASLKSRLDADAELEEGETALSLAQQNAEAERRRAELRVQSIQDELSRLNQIAADTQQRMGETPRVAERLEALSREYQHLYANYQDFSNRRLEAGVAANMERRQKGEQFRVLESAYASDEATSPNRPLIVSLGILVGLGLGAALAVLLEGMDSSYHSPRALQTALRIPVLATVPSILFDADRVASRNRRMRFVMVGMVLTGVMLVSSAGGYWWVNLRGRPSAEADQAAPAAEQQGFRAADPAAVLG